jgi:GrpB-like predicted nucleotidyltransferase (UPF0157 family)
MSTKRLSHLDAVRRLIRVYLERCAEDELFALRVALSDVLDFETVERVVAQDLFASYDEPPHREALASYGWDEHRARELIRRWLAKRPASSFKKRGQS